jgi:murein L,D-transpeptidase YafK
MRAELIALAFALLIDHPQAGERFKSRQAAYPRVKAAITQKGASLRALFAQQKLDYPPSQAFIRVFKRERVLELWVAGAAGDPLQLLKKYSLCAISGGPGPKREMGDGQIPEGFYLVDRFNPVSSFHLSLGINYPNAADRINGVKGRLGGDIFIHGGCVTIGCMPITDEAIKELYLVAIEATAAGQHSIPVHIFPARLDREGLRQLDVEPRADPALRTFWLNLKEGFDFFELQHRIPKIGVDRSGRYVVAKE